MLKELIEEYLNEAKKIHVWYKGKIRTLKPGVTFNQFQEKYPDAVKTKAKPTMRTMKKWMDDGVAKAIDGCQVEPDGYCKHGYPSWLIALGMM